MVNKAMLSATVTKSTVKLKRTEETICASCKKHYLRTFQGTHNKPSCSAICNDEKPTVRPQSQAARKSEGIYCADFAGNKSIKFLIEYH